MTGSMAAGLLLVGASFGASAQLRFAHPAVRVPAPAAAPNAKAPQARLIQAGVRATTGLVDLGRLDKPGASLRQKRFELVPGGTLRFVTGESASRGLGQVQVPPGAVIIRRTVLRAAKPGLAGGASEVEYRFTLPVSIKPGVYKVSASGAFPVRRDPMWAFAFELRVGKRKIGDPRPL